jgi:hypothetical protein
MKYISNTFFTAILSFVLLGSSTGAFADSAQKFNITVNNGDNSNFYLTYNSNPSDYPNDPPQSTIYKHTSDNFTFEMISPATSKIKGAGAFYGPTLVYSNAQNNGSLSCTFEFTGDDNKGCVAYAISPAPTSGLSAPLDLCGVAEPTYNSSTSTCYINFYIY